MRRYSILIITTGLLLVVAGIHSCKTTGTGAKDAGVITGELISNPDGTGVPLELRLVKGKSFNHPTFSIWLEDNNGNFLQTLFVTRSFGSGTFTYGDASGGQWKPGQVKRPAALPYWSHKAGAAKGMTLYVPDASNPVPDAMTGATPKGSFLLNTRGDKKNSTIVRLFLEINQTWDWNPFWTNNKYPGDREYMTSCQPAVIYTATLDLSKPGSSAELLPIGRSSHNGSDGKLYTDLETLTTALNIAETITVTVGGQ